MRWQALATSRWATNGLRALAFFGLVAGGVAGVQLLERLAKVDPFGKFRQEGPLGGEIAMRLEDVDLRQYDGTRLVAEATVDRIDVRNDRLFFALYGVRDGRVRSDDAGEVRFWADMAEWDRSLEILRVRQGARVANRDLDLRTTELEFTRKDGLLRAPGKLTGTLGGGQVTLTTLNYNAQTRTAETGPVAWSGELALQLPEQGPSRRTWTIQGERSRIKGDVRTVVNGEATDGEVIVKGALVEYDRRSDVMTVTGKVSYFAPEANMTCEKAVIYRRERRAILTGAVNMLVKPRNQRDRAKVEEIPPFSPLVPDAVLESRPKPPPEGEEDPVRRGDNLRDFPVAIRAERIEYWYRRGERRAIATGDPQARQTFPSGAWRHGWATRADYDGEKETLNLTGRNPSAYDVRVRTSSGDDLQTTDAEMSTREDGEDDLATGRVKGSMMDAGDDDPRGDRTQDPPPPGLRGPIGGQRPRASISRRARAS